MQMHGDMANQKFGPCGAGDPFHIRRAIYICDPFGAWGGWISGVPGICDPSEAWIIRLPRKLRPATCSFFKPSTLNDFRYA